MPTGTLGRWLGSPLRYSSPASASFALDAIDLATAGFGAVWEEIFPLGTLSFVDTSSASIVWRRGTDALMVDSVTVLATFKATPHNLGFGQPRGSRACFRLSSKWTSKNQETA